MDITVSEPRPPAPPVRNERVDWHALSEDEQRCARNYLASIYRRGRSSEAEWNVLPLKAQVYLRRHCGA